jgi:hypothetical protein
MSTFTPDSPSIQPNPSLYLQGFLVDLRQLLSPNFAVEASEIEMLSSLYVELRLRTRQQQPQDISWQNGSYQDLVMYTK